MLLALLLALLNIQRICAEVYGMTLTSIQYPAPSSASADEPLSVVPLRGPPGRHGDVWGPADPGTNILPCGSLGNTDTYDRMEVEKGTPFNLMGTIWKTMNGEGTLTFSIKYGTKPDFRATNGMLLLEYTPTQLTLTPADWVVTTAIPEPAFSDNATIQIEYMTGTRPDNWTEPLMSDDNELMDRPWSSVYQCIDLTVTGAKPKPAGAGDDYNPDDFAPTPGTKGVVTSDNSTGKSMLPVGYIILIALAVLLALCVIILVVCFLCRKKKPEEAQEPEKDVPNIKAPDVPPPQSPPEGPHVRLHFEEPENPPPAVPTPETPEEPKEGSFGRLFHFKYVEADEEHGAEDLARQQQKRTLDRGRTLQQEFDQADEKHS